MGTRRSDLDRREPPATIPGRNASETRRYAKMGEIPYMRMRLRRALGWIEAHPADYTELVARRFVAFWTGSARLEARYWFYSQYDRVKHILFSLPAFFALMGLILAWRRRARGVGLLAFVLAAYPIVYSLTLVYPKYRLPIEPLLLVFAALAVIARSADGIGSETASEAW